MTPMDSYRSLHVWQLGYLPDSLVNEILTLTSSTIGLLLGMLRRPITTQE